MQKYSVSIEFDKFRKQFHGVTDLEHPSKENGHMLIFTSSRGEKFRFNQSAIVSYMYEEDT